MVDTPDMKLNCVYIHKNKNYNTVGGLQYIADHVADILKILDKDKDLHP